MRAPRVAACTMAVVWLQACTVTTPRPVAEPAPVPPPPTPVVQHESRAPQESAAPVAALISQAREAQRTGRLEQAAANVERALRIDPSDALAWQLLAAIRLAQGEAGQAEVVAARSNDLAAGDRALQRDNWLIIAEARRLQGDAEGAQAATRHARSYNGT
jgi:Flp pilus assembly protein TadD